jgi:hypothetical protein
MIRWVLRKTKIIKRLKTRYRNKVAIQIAYNQVKIIRRNIAEIDNTLDKKDLSINKRIKYNEDRRSLFHGLLDLKKKIRQLKGKDI